MSKWALAPLGQLVTQVDRSEAVVPDGNYRLLGVRLEGNGAFHRETVTGTETSASRLNRVESGDFIYSRLFAWRGAFGLIAAEFDGCYVSNEFPLFRVDDTKLDADYLNRWFQRPAVWRRVEEDCTGSTPTTRNRFKEKYFLNLEIPLPSLAEQQSIVARLNALADQTRQLSAHLDAIEADADHLMIALATRSDLIDQQRRKRGWIEGSIGDVLKLTSEPVSVRASQSYRNVGVLSFARGLFDKPPIDGSITSASTLYRIRAGQFLYSRLFAFEGAYAIVEKEHDGAFVSNEFPAFSIDPERASPAFFYAYFRSPQVWEKIAHGSIGLGDRRQRVRPTQLLSHKLWLPPRAPLDTLDTVFPFVRALKIRYTSLLKANSALLLATLERLFA